MLHILYEGLLEDLIIDKKDLSNSEKIKLVQIISNYIVPKTKPIRDEATLEKIKERNSDHFTNEPDPTK